MINLYFCYLAAGGVVNEVLMMPRHHGGPFFFVLVGKAVNVTSYLDTLRYAIICNNIQQLKYYIQGIKSG